jgi:hypothetical protein
MNKTISRREFIKLATLLPAAAYLLGWLLDLEAEVDKPKSLTDKLLDGQWHSFCLSKLASGERKLSIDGESFPVTSEVDRFVIVDDKGYIDFGHLRNIVGKLPDEWVLTFRYKANCLHGLCLSQNIERTYPLLVAAQSEQSGSRIYSSGFAWGELNDERA